MERYDIIIEGTVRIKVPNEAAADAEVARIVEILNDLSVDADCWDDDELVWEVGTSEPYDAAEYAMFEEDE